MKASEFRTALEGLGLNVASQRTAKLLGLNVRQTQRLASGDARVPNAVVLLLDMYRKHGTDEHFRRVRCGKHNIGAVMVDESGIWDVTYPWGTERLQGLHTTSAQLAKAIRARFKRKQDKDKQAAAA